MSLALNAAAIRAAHSVIDPVFLRSPLLELDAVSEALGVRFVSKVETLNPIRCFKGRGTDYLVRQRTASGFVCASAGNFGQGMAYACRAAKRRLTVFAATSANPLKVERMQRLGATVTLHGEDFDDAKEAARAYAKAHGETFVEDGKDNEVSVGAGTIALELTEALEALDVVIVPVGNGALINGMGTWLKAERPDVRVVGVVAVGAPAMDLSWRARRVVDTDSAATIADGIAVRKPVPEAVDIMHSVVDEVVQVTDERLLEAMRIMHQHAGLVLEPAGAAGVAAALQHAAKFEDAVVAAPLCGSNLTPEQMSRWL